MRIGNSRKPSQRSSWRQPAGRRSGGLEVKLYVVCFVALVPLTVCANDSVAQLPEPVELEHFQFVRAITFSDPDKVHPDTLLITSIWSLDVAADGRMLVVDMRGSQALLFDSSGRLLAMLDPSVCHPGFEVRPVHAKFIKDHSIFLSNAGPWGYRFTPDGDCLGSVDPDYTSYSAGLLDADASGDLFGAYEFPDRQVLTHMDASGKTLEEYLLPASEYPKATYRIRGGGLIADKTHVFYVGPVEPQILKLTRDGSVVDRIANKTRWFRYVTKDLTDTNPSDLSAMMQAGGRIIVYNTIITGLFEITDQAILVQFHNGDRGRGHQVFTKDGELIAQELGIQASFEFGKAGLVYRVVPLAVHLSEELANPYIEVYRFIPPQ